MAHRQRRWFGLVIAIALLVALRLPMLWSNGSSEIVAAEAIASELRGVWLTNIDSDVLFSQQSVQQAVQRLQRLNFNTLYPTVWNWGYTLYPSAVAKRETGRSLDPHPGLQGRDMLAELVELGHDAGFAVIPWVEFGLMAPADSELVARHPNWVTQRHDGSQIVMEGEHPRVWLNPALPEVRQFLVDLVTELVSTYNIDGIQFDDHLGLPVELGYDDYSVTRYREEHDGNDPPRNIHDPEWVRWRAAHITMLMEDIFDAVKAVRSDCLVALAPNPREFAYEMYLQDWWSWERRGFIEELIVQVYRDNMERFEYELEQPEVEQVRSHIPLGIGILTGLRNRPVEMDLIAQQVQAVRDRQLAGVSFFFYETLGDRDDEFLDLFPEPIASPNLLINWRAE